MGVPFGGIYGLLGPSGCGKTTTVKIMSGILEATSGDTFVLGEKMPQLNLMNEIGYMAQSDALYSMLSGEDNLACAQHCSCYFCRCCHTVYIYES